MFDNDGGGSLSIREINPLLHELGKAPKSLNERNRLTELLAEIDEDGTGEFEFPEFLQLMRRFVDDREALQLQKELAAVAKVGWNIDEVNGWRTVFVKFDEEKCGSFKPAHGRKLLQAVGVALQDKNSDAQYQEYFKKVDDDGDGHMDFPEFLIFMKHLIDDDFMQIASKTLKRGKR
jgi:Ca2+-binding EF-hand superfamily protein